MSKINFIKGIWSNPDVFLFYTIVNQCVILINNYQ